MVTNLNDTQLVCLLFALPFLSLSLAWLIGLSILFRQPKAIRIPVKDRNRHG